MKQVEDRVNKQFHYPYVFLNEEPFSDQFRKSVYCPKIFRCRLLTILRRVSEVTESKVQFGLIPHDHWYQPASIDEAKAKASREKMAKDGVIYGGTWHQS